MSLQTLSQLITNENKNQCFWTTLSLVEKFEIIKSKLPEKYKLINFDLNVYQNEDYLKVEDG